MREYEVTIIIQPQLNDEAREQLIEQVGKWLTDGSENADKPAINRWGQRRLAYPIENYREGFYVLYEARLSPGRIADIERNLQYAEDVIRYLVVRKEK